MAMVSSLASCFKPSLKLLSSIPPAAATYRPHVVVRLRALKDEQEPITPSTSNNIDFDGKLPLFAPPVFQRRFVLGTIGGSLIALGADFLGSTSAILSLNPDFFRGLRADVLAAQRGERERSLDLPSLRQQQPQQQITNPRKPRPTEPVVAFGPPGTLGELNVSVVVAPVAEGFTLEKLGDPTEAGMLFLKTIAPEGSNKVAKLVEAASRQEDVLYYSMEYTVQGPKFFRHNVAVLAVSDAGELYTLTAQAPESSWSSVEAQFRVITASFRLLPPSPATY